MHPTVNLFVELSLVMVIGASIALIMKYLRQPLIFGHILTGIIAGPALLNIVHDQGSFEVFSNIGIALLLFIIGLELSIKVFSRLGSAIFLTAGLQIVVTTFFGFSAARLFNFGVGESIIIGLSLALSSTIVIVKVLNDKKELTRLFAQVAIGILLIQDLVGTAGKIGLASYAHNESNILAFVYLLIRSIVAIAGLYLISKYVIPKLTKVLEDSTELMLVFSLAWGLGIATLFQAIGLSIETGALFAGVSMASLPFSTEMASRLKPLRDFFIVIFFITLGHTLMPGRISNIWLPALVFTLIVVIIKPLMVLAGMGFLGYTKRASFKTAISMSQISEFSLVFLFAANASGVASDEAKAAVTLVALITFAGSAYLMKYDDSLYKLVEDKLQFFERRVIRYEQKESEHYYPIVLIGYRKGGAEFIRTFKKMKKRFIVIDYDPEAIEHIERQHTHYLYGDATDPDMMEELRLDKAKLIVSTISDFKSNHTLAHWLKNKNPRAILIASADSTINAAKLYAEGASYVMMPHFIGSEKMSTFIQKSGFKKSDFRRYRQKQLGHLATHYSNESI